MTLVTVQIRVGTIAISGVTGTIAYHVILNTFETDTLVLNFKKNSLGRECCRPAYILEIATYNGTPIAIISSDSVPKKIIITK
ncbi:hypothetical protein [Maribacter antarcticus]|uniref:hypothetical protein n=1 Tax=Maribacter antarcticus TaxID=505250 RepID=UPI0012ECA689|nr:hypothetical protein [Maribacter antarcticus]